MFYEADTIGVEQPRSERPAQAAEVAANEGERVARLLVDRRCRARTEAEFTQVGSDAKRVCGRTPRRAGHVERRRRE